MLMRPSGGWPTPNLDLIDTLEGARPKLRLGGVVDLQFLKREYAAALSGGFFLTHVSLLC